MNTARKIESAIELLPTSEQEQLASWFEQRFQNQWDKQLEADAASGKLDSLFERLSKEGDPQEKEVRLDDQKLP